MNRKMLKDRAKAVLKKDYVKLLGFTFIVVVLGASFIGFGSTADYNTGLTYYYFSIFGLSFPINVTKSMVGLVSFFVIAGLLMGVFVRPILNFGLENAYKSAAVDELQGYDLFNGFKQNYSNIVKVNLMKNIFTFLWALCFIIPGLIKAYQWRYTNQILAEHPDWDYKQVLEASEALTQNQKLNLFVLDLSFIGWYILFSILDLLTIGLASYLLNPYVFATNAEAYYWLKSLQEPQVIDVEVEAEIIE